MSNEVPFFVRSIISPTVSPAFTVSPTVFMVVLVCFILSACSFVSDPTGVGLQNRTDLDKVGADRDTPDIQTNGNQLPGSQFPGSQLSESQIPESRIHDSPSSDTPVNIPAVTESAHRLPVPVHLIAVKHSKEPVLAKQKKTIERKSVQHSASQNTDNQLYTVIADTVPLKELLFTLARDSATRIDVAGEIAGDISLSMIQQPLMVILNEIANQVPIRFEARNDHIVVVADTPFLHSYQVDYLNMQRVSESRVDLATQVGSIRTDIESGSSAQTGSNGSQLFVENKTENSLWRSLLANIAGILEQPFDSENLVSENIFVNRETGIITVRATGLQHRSIEQLLSEVINSAQRQVLIEATVVEVTLSDRFESGVDWQVLNQNANEGFDYTQNLGGFPQAAQATNPVTALLTYSAGNSVLGNLTATLKLLRQFGDVQVLSSPKIIALNNQPAVLKVVDNRVYFTFEVDRVQRQNGDEQTLVDSTVHSVPIGLVMNVTPFINSTDEVILNVRPTISRILNFAEDPSPALAGQTQVRNLIPEIQVREMESLLRVQSGEVAIIGGLMQNRTDNIEAGVPGLRRMPWLGKLFSYSSRVLEKTELLIFLRPTVMASR